MKLSIEIGNDERIFRLAEKVRMKVFVDEQGFSADIEIDDTDKTAFHAAVYNGSEVIGAARFFEENGGYHVGRVAVLSQYRGKGVGKYIMNEIEAFAKKENIPFLVLSAQTRAAEFYLKCGFEKLGDIYLEEGCPHIQMRKIIK